MSKVIFEIRPATGARLKVEVIVRDEPGTILFSDRCDLASIDGRRHAAKALCARMHSLGIEKAPEHVEAVLETKWNEFLEQRDREAAAADSADGPTEELVEDLDSQALRLLEAMPRPVVAEAEALLKEPTLLAQLVADIEAAGVAGEKELATTLYLVGVSRKLDHPLSALVRGPSASGKSYAIAKVASLFPPEVVLYATQMTSQALFHMQTGALRHRWIVAGERSRNQDDDRAEATRALREMISSGKLTKLMPVKLGNTIQTEIIEQEGPIAFVESTTLEQIFEEDESGRPSDSPSHPRRS
jgi:hypothetical protein